VHCKVSLALKQASGRTGNASLQCKGMGHTAHWMASSCPAHPRPSEVSPRTAWRAKLQQTIAQLQTKDRRELRGPSTNADRLLLLHSKSPSTADLSTSVTTFKAWTGLTGKVHLP